MPVTHRGPLKAAKGFLADLREQRLDGTQALEIEVAVQAAVTQEKFVTENVGFHGQALCGVKGGTVCHVERGGIGVCPKLIMPVWVLLPPAVGPGPGLHRERIWPEPDLVNEPGKAGEEGCSERDAGRKRVATEA